MKNIQYIKNENNNTVKQKTFFYKGYEFDVNSSNCHDRDMKAFLESQGLPFREGDSFSDIQLEATIATLSSARATMKNPHTFHIVLGLNDNCSASKIMQRLRRISPDPIAYIWSLENKNKITHAYLHVHLFLIIDLPENLNTEKYRYLKKYVEDHYNNHLAFSGIHKITNLGTESKFSKIPSLSDHKTVKNLKDDKEFEEAIKHASYLCKQTTKYNLSGKTFGTSQHSKDVTLELENFYRCASFKKAICIGDITFDLILELERAGKQLSFLFTFQNWRLPEEDSKLLDSIVNHLKKEDFNEWIEAFPLSSESEDEIIVSCQVLPFFDEAYRDSQKALRHKYLTVPAVQILADDLEEAFATVLEVIVKKKLLRD